MESTVSLLAFRIGSHLFAIRTDVIKSVIEVYKENIKETASMPDYVVGYLKYEDQVYVLICLSKLLKVEEDCKLDEPKNAIVLNINNKTWAILVDEVKQIFEEEGTEYKTDEVNVFSLDNEVVEELLPSFFEKHIEVPPLKLPKVSVGAEENQKETKELLLVKIKNESFAFDMNFVLKVEELEEVKTTVLKTAKDNIFNKVHLVGDRIIKSASLGEILGLGSSNKENNLVILEDKEKTLGIEVDEILDMKSIPTENIIEDKNNNDIFTLFVRIEDKVVPIFSSYFLSNLIEKNGLPNKKLSKDISIKNNTDIHHFLIFSIGDKNLAIEMEKIERIYKIEDVHISPYPSKIKEIKGIVATRKKTYFLISLEDVLNTSIEKSEENRILILKTTEDSHAALIISEVKNMISVSQDNIFLSSENGKFLVRGAIIDGKGNCYEVLNPDWILACSKHLSLPSNTN